MTTLADYEAALLSLLQAPQQPTPLITAAQQALFINQARQHVAAEGECVRVYGNLPLVVGQRSYTFGTITFGAATGIIGVNALRTLWYTVAAGQIRVNSYNFDWFSLYYLNNPVPPTGPPGAWAQLGQGQSGTVFVDPLPDIVYACPVDMVAAPSNLVQTTDTEAAIPPLWRDAVPFYAAWLGFKNLLRQADAAQMMTDYKDMMERARAGATPSVLPQNHPQATDPMLMNRLGVSPRQSGGGGEPA